jgi:hypothetical protein
MTEMEWLGESNTEKMLQSLRDHPSARKLRLFSVACCRRVYAYFADQGLFDSLRGTGVIVEELLDDAERRLVAGLDGAEAFAEGLLDDGERQTLRGAVMELVDATWQHLLFVQGYYLAAVAQSLSLPGEWVRQINRTGNPDHPDFNAAGASYCAAQARAWDVAGQCEPPRRDSFWRRVWNTVRGTRFQDDLGLSEAARQCLEETERLEVCQQAHLVRDIFGNPFRPVTVASSWLTPAVRGVAQEIYNTRHLPQGTFDTTRLAILADALEDAGCDQDDILAHCRSEGPHVRGCWPVDLLLGRG